jgi:tetratricopeptide (TPR) repeat protein
MQMRSKADLMGILLIALLSLVIFSNSLGNEFCFDDNEIIVKNYLIKDLKNIPTIFATSYWSGTLIERNELYRPLVILSYAINYYFNQLDPRYYHLVNLLLHTFNCILIFYLGKYYFRKYWPSLLVALLFVSHPIHTEAVTGVVGRAELLATFFFLSSWILYLKRLPGRLKGGMDLYGLSLLCFFLALLSKENAVTLIAVLIAHDFIFKSQQGRQNPDKSISKLIKLEYLGYIFVLIIYLSIRYLILGQLTATSTIPFIDNPLAHTSLLPRLLTAAKVTMKYLYLLILPLNLSADYSYRQIPVSSTVFEWETFISLIVIIIVLSGIVWSYRRSGEILFSIIFFSITFSTVSNFIVPIGTIMGERLLYLPSLGFFMFCVLLFEKAFRLKPMLLLNKRIPIFLIILFLLILSLYSYRTMLRNRDWANEYNLFHSAVTVSPNSAKTHYKLGIAYAEVGMYDEAIQEYRRALHIYPYYVMVFNSLGVIYFNREMYDEAIREYQKALEIKPDFAEAHMNLGIAYAKKGMYDEAIRENQKALEIKPDFAEAFCNLGDVYRDKGMYDEAISEYQQILYIDPDNAESYNSLGVAYFKKGMDDEAISEYQKALELKPDFAETHYNLGVLYYYRKQYDLAVRCINNAEKLGYPVPLAFMEMLQKASKRHRK